MTTTGTIAEYTPPTTFVVKETSGPVMYLYGKNVIYVTKSGKNLTDEDVKNRMKVGVPVTVTYTKDGDKRTLTRVELNDNENWPDPRDGTFINVVLGSVGV